VLLGGESFTVASQLLVRVMASALNPLDVKILAGMAEHVPKTRSF
jgi:NADPH:quinone reductase-like Zn-dependent oxidoreductase